MATATTAKRKVTSGRQKIGDKKVVAVGRVGMLEVLQGVEVGGEGVDRW